MVAAINWVTEHAHDNGLNIRVLNLSYGTPAGQDYTLDPLAYAVENAWRKGIVVVVSGGNDGTSFQSLANPAQDPPVIAVGAEDPVGTEQPLDDTVPGFSDRGTALRHVDVVAPGRARAGSARAQQLRGSGSSPPLGSAPGSSVAAAPRRRLQSPPGPRRCCCRATRR